jgi:hypothetical protein
MPATRTRVDVDEVAERPPAGLVRGHEEAGHGGTATKREEDTMTQTQSKAKSKARTRTKAQRSVDTTIRHGEWIYIPASEREARLCDEAMQYGRVYDYACPEFSPGGDEYETFSRAGYAVIAKKEGHAAFRDPPFPARPRLFVCGTAKAPGHEDLQLPGWCERRWAAAKYIQGPFEPEWK